MNLELTPPLSPIDVGSFLTAYIVIPWFFLMQIGWKIYKKTKFVRLDDMDFDSGKRQRECPSSLALQHDRLDADVLFILQWTRWRRRSGPATRRRRPGTKRFGTRWFEEGASLLLSVFTSSLSVLRINLYSPLHGHPPSLSCLSVIVRVLVCLLSFF